MELGDRVHVMHGGARYTGRITRLYEKWEEATVTFSPGVDMLVPYHDITKIEETTMELDEAEKKHMAAVAGDPDLMIRSREFVGASDAVPAKEVLNRVHADYDGGISQFYLANRF